MMYCNGLKGKTWKVKFNLTNKCLCCDKEVPPLQRFPTRYKKFCTSRCREIYKRRLMCQPIEAKCTVCGISTAHLPSLLNGRPKKRCELHSIGGGPRRAPVNKIARRKWELANRAKLAIYARQYARQHRQTPKGKAMHLLRKAWRRARTKNQTASRLPAAWANALLVLDSCAYCLAPLQNGTRSLDHVTPLSKGGAHDESNVVLACLPCNIRKGAKTLLEFIMAQQP